MANGIVRRIDELGRITLPVEIRRRYGMEDGDRLGITFNGNIIRVSQVVTGMSRPLDEYGRVVIPMELRNTLKFAERQEVAIWAEDKAICITKVVSGCIICGCTEQLMDVDGVLICRSCGVKVVDKFMGD